MEILADLGQTGTLIYNLRAQHILPYCSGTHHEQPEAVSSNEAPPTPLIWDAEAVHQPWVRDMYAGCALAYVTKGLSGNNITTTLFTQSQAVGTKSRTRGSHNIIVDMEEEHWLSPAFQPDFTYEDTTGRIFLRTFRSGFTLKDLHLFLQ